MREVYWQRVCPESCNELTPASERPPANIDLIQNLDRLRATNRAYIWAGTDIHDQLFLLFVVNLMMHEGIETETVRLIPFDTRTDLRLPFYSVAVLTPDNLSAHPLPVPLTEKQRLVCHSAWAAITAPTPDAMVAFLHNRDATMPHVRRTVGQLLHRFPQRESGLSFLDRMLLGNVKSHAPNVARVIGETLCDIWLDGDNVGDAYLYHRLQLMGDEQLPQPLLELRNGTRPYREADVALTDFGQAVLEGRVSNYPTNPIDEWIGGVHLSSKDGNLWMHDRGRLQRIALD